MNRMTANNTKISYKLNSASSFTELEYLMEVPEFGGAPEKIDVTTLSDKVKKYVPGIKDLGDLVFKFLYDNSSETANYRVLKSMENAGTAVTSRVFWAPGGAMRSSVPWWSGTGHCTCCLKSGPPDCGRGVRYAFPVENKSPARRSSAAPCGRPGRSCT
jgi:hypothetical protein